MHTHRHTYSQCEVDQHCARRKHTAVSNELACATSDVPLLSLFMAEQSYILRFHFVRASILFLLCLETQATWLHTNKSALPVLVRLCLRKRDAKQFNITTQLKRSKENQRIETSQPQKVVPASFRPSAIHKNKEAHIEIKKKKTHSEESTTCSKLYRACKPSLTLKERTKASEHLLLPS